MRLFKDTTGRQTSLVKSITQLSLLQVESKEIDVGNLFALCKVEKYGRNEVIFNLKNHSNYIYYLQNGKVKVTDISSKGRFVTSGFYKPGEFINLDVIQPTALKKTSATAKSKNTVVLKISKRDFLLRLSNNTGLQQRVFGQLLAERKELEQRIQQILDIKSSGRVYDFLYHHTLKFGERVGYEYVIREPLTHQEIAEYIGTSRQTVTTSMNNLKRKGLFHFSRNYWIIRDLKSLEKIVASV